MTKNYVIIPLFVSWVSFYFNKIQVFIYNLNTKEQGLFARCILFTQNRGDAWWESFVIKSLFRCASLKINWIFIDSLVKVACRVKTNKT